MLGIEKVSCPRNDSVPLLFLKEAPPGHLRRSLAAHTQLSWVSAKPTWGPLQVEKLKMCEPLTGSFTMHALLVLLLRSSGTMGVPQGLEVGAQTRGDILPNVRLGEEPV